MPGGSRSGIGEPKPHAAEEPSRYRPKKADDARQLIRKALTSRIGSWPFAGELVLAFLPTCGGEDEVGEPVEVLHDERSGLAPPPG